MGLLLKATWPSLFFDPSFSIFLSSAMFGKGSGELWAAHAVGRPAPGRLPPALPVPASFPHHLQDFAPPRAVAWTEEENRVFEAALGEFDGAAEDERCRGIAERIPGKTPEDVREHYRRLERDLTDIESGVTELPEYADGCYDPGAAAAGCSDGRARQGSSRAKPEERKKGNPWTEEEHRRFLEGLEKYGKGDWRSISRNSVVTRTPTQVASHAQKYFLRQSTEGKKDRRRSSIHDVTGP